MAECFVKIRPFEREEGGHRMEGGVVRAGGGTVETATRKQKVCVAKRVYRSVPFCPRVIRRHATTPSARAFRYRGYSAASYAATSTGLALIGRSNARTRSYSALMFVRRSLP